jgi:hypothetical protein
MFYNFSPKEKKTLKSKKTTKKSLTSLFETVASSAPQNNNRSKQAK